ncbi:MAG TPA: glutamine--tRNA ligase/YqeY domain fusion protein [Candidatus Marinimicrobia bacterium]|jgi:glutaminyl-tRNA synthetase|nr:glutamine--tRNA ligase/YqeY domain fusion protein [Candidatus Neomarinimicrobiota bacterium]
MSENEQQSNFIRDIIDSDLESGKNDNRVHTRFPPEPNGYLHIGHAKSICLNFGIAEDYPKGKCNLRFDDTNPVKEDEEYVESIIEDVKWLGFDFEDRLFFASDYFQQLFDYAVLLIKSGKAYVDDQSADEIRDTRGTLKEPGVDSPHRNRSEEENLILFNKMKAGEFGNGEKVLRAKIDMAHPNLNMRDPVIYRILHASHHRTGDDWCVYPMYDWAHGLEDSIEGITHSICTLEFEDHRPLYDWFLDQLGVYHPQQIEFARLNLNYTVMSKRKLKLLVDGNHVAGWDDPRMPTISGLRRRGYTPESIREFANRIGVAKRDGVIDMALLDHCLREDLNKRALRAMAVLDPVKVIVTNYPEEQVEELDAENNPEDESAGKRKLPFARELYIERSDFMENPPKKFFRLGLEREVRLKHAYYITCTDFIKNEKGEVTEIHCTYDPATKGGWSDDGRKVRGTLHWVSAKHAVDAEVRFYDHLFNVENPETDGDDFIQYLNPNSLIKTSEVKLEIGLQGAAIGTNYQFLRNGYFCLDLDSTEEKLIFNRTVGLRDSWSKKQKV